MSYSVVVPCYRSEVTIREVVTEVIDVFEKHNTEDFEVILVNDCSPDNVWEVIIELSCMDSRIKGISMSKNFGQHSALMAGYIHSKGDIIISMDDDGQTPFGEIFSLIEKLEEGYDVVYAHYLETHTKKVRTFGTNCANKMGEFILDAPKDIKGSSFFVMKKFVKEEIIKYKNPYPYLYGLVLRTTRNIATVDMSKRTRFEGQSGYSFMKLIKLWMNGFTAFSVKPLEIGSIMGLGCSVIGFLVAIITIIRKIIRPEIVAGWSSIIAVLLIVGGVLMIMLGLIGEYIGRIYICINNSPQYVIKDKTENW